MDEYLIQLDNIIKQTTNSLHSNNMFSTENMVETIKEISKNLKKKLEVFKKQEIDQNLTKTEEAQIFYEQKYKNTVEMLQNLEAEINTNAKNMMENKENIVNGYFDINDIINKENIAKKTILNTQNEENDYFEKRSYREKILLQLENENCIYEEDFNKMKKHFKYLEMTKSSITQEIKIKNNYLSYLEEREKEYNNKKQKALDHLEKYKHNLAHNIEEKLIIIEKIENFENIRIKENEKINDISKNNLDLEKSNNDMCLSILLANEELKKIKEENENLVRNYEKKFQELDQQIHMSPTRIYNSAPEEYEAMKLRAVFSPTSNNILIIEKDEKKTLFRAKLNTPINSVNNELEYFSEEEFNFYKNKSVISYEEKKSNSNLSLSFKNAKENIFLLQNSNSCKSDKTKEFSKENMEINSYSDEIKRNKGLAKILSCSHFKGEENKNDMIFKSTDLKDIIEIIHNRKPKNNKENEIKVQIDKSKGSTCCGLEECRIF